MPHHDPRAPDTQALNWTSDSRRFWASSHRLEQLVRTRTAPEVCMGSCRSGTKMHRCPRYSLYARQSAAAPNVPPLPMPSALQVWAQQEALLRNLSRREITTLRRGNGTCEGEVTAAEDSRDTATHSRKAAIGSAIDARASSDAASNCSSSSWSKARRLPCCVATAVCFPRCFNHVGEIATCRSPARSERGGKPRGVMKRVDVLSQSSALMVSPQPINRCYPFQHCKSYQE